jgi:hypothetical protein
MLVLENRLKKFNLSKQHLEDGLIQKLKTKERVEQLLFVANETMLAKSKEKILADAAWLTTRLVNCYLTDLRHYLREIGVDPDRFLSFGMEEEEAQKALILTCDYLQEVQKESINTVVLEGKEVGAMAGMLIDEELQLTADKVELSLATLHKYRHIIYQKIEEGFAIEQELVKQFKKNKEQLTVYVVRELLNKNSSLSWS